MEIEKGPIGAVGEHSVKFEGGKLIAEASANVPYGEAGMVIKINSGAVLDALAAAIPGHFDDAIIAGAKALLAQLG
jgi:hypothetical protein